MNHTENYEMTILVPLYNEEENIDRLREVLSDYLAHAGKKSCVLFIDDGSDDSSRKKIQQVCATHDHFFYLGFDTNHGLSSALKAGFDVTYSSYVAYLDADLQTTPEDFELLLPHISDYELVTGIRAERKDRLIKKLSSRLANSFRRAMTHDGVVDTGCPLKIMHTQTAQHLPFFKGMHRFIPALVQLQGGQVWQVPVRHFPRIAGKAKYNLRNRLVSPLIDCFAYRWMKKRNIRYSITEQHI